MDETADDKTAPHPRHRRDQRRHRAQSRPPRAAHLFPSSMGMSLIVPASVKALNVIVRWGDYANDAPLEVAHEIPADEPISVPEDVSRARSFRWRRTPREVPLAEAARPDQAPDRRDLPGEDGLKVALSIRPVEAPELAPPGHRSVSVFVVNRRTPTSDERCDERFAFQVELEVTADEPLIPRPTFQQLGIRTIATSGSPTCSIATPSSSPSATGSPPMPRSVPTATAAR